MALSVATYVRGLHGLWITSLLLIFSAGLLIKINVTLVAELECAELSVTSSYCLQCMKLGQPGT